MSKNDNLNPFNPGTASDGSTRSSVFLKLPFGWAQVGDTNVIELRLPPPVPLHRSVIEAIEHHLGEFADIGIIELVKLGQLRALKEAMKQCD